VRTRTVGDFFVAGQFNGKAAAGVPRTTSNEIPGLLRPYPVMIHYAYALFNEWNGVHVAQKIQTLFIDDIDGSEAEGTVRFALDGAEYEIDLNAKNAEALRKALSRYVEAARRSSGTASRRPSWSSGSGRQRGISARRGCAAAHDRMRGPCVRSGTKPGGLSASLLARYFGTTV